MSSTYGENTVQNFLQSFGFTIAKIPELPEQKLKTPDFLVTDQSVQYLIEVKDKEDNKFMDLINSRISGEKTVGLEYDNTISSIIKEGANQLDSYDKTGNKFKVLWFFIDAALFSSQVSRQIDRTLYGLQEIEGYTKSGKFFQTRCFYFTYSDFYRHKQLDAVIVQRPNEIVLCMNDFSSRSNELRQSKIYQLFEEKGFHIIEPSQMEKDSRCFIADNFSISRKDSESVANYIGKKYNLRQIIAYDFSMFNLPLE